MFDDTLFNAMPTFDECMQYWFVPLATKKFAVMSKVDSGTTWKHPLTVVGIEDDTIVFTSEHVTSLGAETVGAILADWALYTHRPEYLMLKGDADDPVTEYEIEFVGSIFIKEYKLGRNPDNAWSRICRCLEWLRSTDFYTCPASTKYHDSVPGGLLKHSLNVVDRALELVDAPSFDNLVNLDDAVFASLVHDWCKIGLYEPYKKNVKNETTGQWEQQTAYRYFEDRTICMGHGASSMFLAMRFFNISTEVALAIRWHMGRWNVSDSEYGELQQACRNYPLVHLIQFADALAIVNY